MNQNSGAPGQNIDSEFPRDKAPGEKQPGRKKKTGGGTGGGGGRGPGPARPGGHRARSTDRPRSPAPPILYTIQPQKGSIAGAIELIYNSYLIPFSI